MTLEALTALVTLTALEVVLGIDNIIFIAIIVGRLPKSKQFRMRTIGLILALVFRIILLGSLSWMMKLTEPLFSVIGHGFSGRDLILLGGGLFLIVKSTMELHHKMSTAVAIVTEMEEEIQKKDTSKFIFLQIIILDVIFSLDSVITAVGMANQLWIMVTAVVISMIIMILASGWISDFINKNPTIKILALSFLIMIGALLVAEGMGQHVPKGYAYFAMAFSLAIEFLNMRYKKKIEVNSKLKIET